MLVSELIEETRRLLLSGQREERNKLAGPIGTSDTSMTILYPLNQISRGAKLSIDLEDMYVWDASGLIISAVDRGQWGSFPAAHTANTVMHVNPKFSNWEIYNAINDEITSLSSPVNGLYYVTSYALDYNPVITGYSFPFEILDVLDIWYSIPGASLTSIYSSDWEFVRNAGADFSGNSALFIRDAFPNQPVNIRAKVAYPQLSLSMTFNTTTAGAIPEEVLDILSLGAAWRLSAGLETARNYTTAQGDTRRAGEVPPGAALGGSREWGRLREQRIREEASRLSEKYPHKSPRYPFKANYA